jgi:hypothetical protein
LILRRKEKEEEESRDRGKYNKSLVKEKLFKHQNEHGIDRDKCNGVRNWREPPMR